VWINMDTNVLLPQFFSPYPIESEETVHSSMAGIVGTWGRERGLTFYEVELAGHELPRYESLQDRMANGRTNEFFRHAPGPSYRATEYLLGRIPSLSETGNFTTQGSGSGD
jgi:carboxypeptidase D